MNRISFTHLVSSIKIVILFLFFFFFTKHSIAQIDSTASENESFISEENEIPADPPEKIHPVSIRLSSGVPNPLSSSLFRKV